MSRSRPQTHHDPNPATRWYEWQGTTGLVRYYDTERKQMQDVDTGFTFILLDELASVRGWHDASQSGIYSNEIRDIAQDVLVVKAFKAGVLAEGRYKAIKDRVHALGGRYHATCYLAYKDADGGLVIGAIRWKGAALAAWMAFRQDHRAELYEQAVTITGTTPGKKGRVTYYTPVFGLRPIAPGTQLQAIAADKELQEYLDRYLSQRTHDQLAAAPPDADAPPPDDTDAPPLTDDDIPF